MHICMRSLYYSLFEYYIHKINSIHNYYFSWEYVINVLFKINQLICSIFSASWKKKYASFLDQLGAQNALQTFSSLTNQLKISYLQHWDIPALIFYVAKRYEEHAIHVSFRQNNNFKHQETVRHLCNLLLKTK